MPRGTRPERYISQPRITPFAEPSEEARPDQERPVVDREEALGREHVRAGALLPQEEERRGSLTIPMAMKMLSTSRAAT